MEDKTFGEITPISAEPIIITMQATAALVRSFYLAIGSCPFCHGNLSDVRHQNGRRLQHCYSCHFEFYLEGEK